MLTHATKVTKTVTREQATLRMRSAPLRVDSPAPGLLAAHHLQQDIRYFKQITLPVS